MPSYRPCMHMQRLTLVRDFVGQRVGWRGGRRDPVTRHDHVFRTFLASRYIVHVGKLASLHYLPPAECSLTGRSPELAAQAGCTGVCDGGCNARSCVAVAVRLAKVIPSIIPSWYPPEPVVQNISWSQAHCFGVNGAAPS